jgi:hypothetical protein
MDSEITDYITESNAKVQDHISLNPIIIELSGFVGEVFEEAPKDIKYQKAVQSKLNEFAGFAPKLSTQAQEYFKKAKDLKAKAESVIDKVDNATNFLRDIENIDPSKTAIEKAYKILSAVWKTRLLVNVKTEFSTFARMAIQSLEFSKSNDEKYKSDIRITLKQITFAQKAKLIEGSGRVDGQKATMVNQGEVNENKSVGYKWIY